MLRLRYLALLAAVGCSPVSDSSNVPDAPIDSTDTRPPMIESSIPMNMGTKVSVLSPVSVFFDESLDPASVTATTVKLGYNNNVQPLVFPGFNLTSPHGPVPASGLSNVKGTVSYDVGTRKVSFLPAAPLPNGFVFTLQLDVKDKAGLAFTGNVSFTTFINSQTKQYFFGGANGNPSSWIGQPLDMNGRLAKRVGGSAPGTDTIWFTADDPKNQHYDFKFDADGRIQEERLLSAGGDGLYDTGDDVTSYCVRYTYDSMKMMTERTYSTTPGPDNVMCTADDVPAVNSIYTYMGPTLTGWIYNSSPGTDNTWRTTDDKCSIYFDYAYDGTGRKTREIYKTCSTDGFAHTADDLFNYYYQYEYDADGYVTKRTYFSGPGADNMWLTGDDAIAQVDKYTRNAEGSVTEQWFSYSPGPDMMFNTADDTGAQKTITTYKDKLAEEIVLYTAFGADSLWGTADDVINNYQRVSYDALGNRVDQKFFVAGADGMWKTPDDRINQDFDFDLSR